MKQRSLKIRKYGVLMAFLLAVSMIFGTFAGVNVYADDTGTTASASDPYDPDQRGSITVKLGDIEGQEPTGKNGVELTLYKVGDVNTEDNYIRFDLAAELREVGSLAGLDLNAVTTEEANR